MLQHLKIALNVTTINVTTLRQRANIIMEQCLLCFWWLPSTCQVEVCGNTISIPIPSHSHWSIPILITIPVHYHFYSHFHLNSATSFHSLRTTPEKPWKH